MMLRWFVLVSLARLYLSTDKYQSSVLELNQKFLDVKNDGMWLVAFYAPWCGHCKRLQPVWELVGLALSSTLVRVGRLDCTQYSQVASAVEVSGYPTIKFFRYGVPYVYEGERTKESIVDFAMKVIGPEVRNLQSSADFLSAYVRHRKDVFFLLITELSMPAEDATTAAAVVTVLKDLYHETAKRLFTRAYFYEIAKQLIPKNFTFADESGVLVIKGDAFYLYDIESNSSLLDWVQLERWIDVPLVNYGNLHDIGTSNDRFLVLAVLHLVEKSKLFEMIQNVWRNYREELREKFQFGWLDGNDIANSIVSRTMPIPSLMVLNVSSYQYYLPDDDVEKMTEQSIYTFLTEVADNKLKPLGGRGYLQGLRRVSYELYVTIYAMFANQPLLACCLIGLPLGILSVICYTICSTDVSFDSEEVYRSSEEEDESDHEKAE